VPVEKNSAKLSACKPRTIDRVGIFLDEDVDNLQKIFRMVFKIRIVDDREVTGGALERRLYCASLALVGVMPKKNPLNLRAWLSGLL
jgi:hypothetical protein